MYEEHTYTPIGKTDFRNEQTPLFIKDADSLRHDVVYFDDTNTEYSPAFNPLYNIAPEHLYIVTSTLISTFKKIWAEIWGRAWVYPAPVLVNTIALSKSHIAWYTATAYQ